MTAFSRSGCPRFPPGAASDRAFLIDIRPAASSQIEGYRRPPVARGLDLLIALFQKACPSRHSRDRVPRPTQVIATNGRVAVSAALGSSAGLVPDAQRKHAEQGRAVAELVAVLAIKRGSVAMGGGAGLIGLARTRATASLALPAHDGALGPESGAMTEQLAAQAHPPPAGSGRRGDVHAIGYPDAARRRAEGSR